MKRKLWLLMGGVVAVSLLGRANPTSAADPPNFKPTISANPATVALEATAKTGKTTLTYNGGAKHPYVEVWVSVNGADLKKVLEDEGDGKGTRTVTVEAGKKYRYVLTDFGKELASAEVITKSAGGTTGGGATTGGGETGIGSGVLLVMDLLTNKFRKDNAVAPLTASLKLNQIAMDYAKVMAEKEKVGRDVDGQDIDVRIKAAGYTYVAFTINVTRTADEDPKAAIEMWKNSKDGRQKMLSIVCTEMGNGAAKSKSGKTYYCQLLAKPK